MDRRELSKIMQPTGYLLMTLFAVLLAMPLRAQETSGAAEPPAGEEVAGEAADTAADTGDEEAADETEEDVDDSDLDDQVYEEDDDDFIPSEEIPADEAIPFPTNI